MCPRAGCYRSVGDDAGPCVSRSPRPRPGGDLESLKSRARGSASSIHFKIPAGCVGERRAADVGEAGGNRGSPVRPAPPGAFFRDRRVFWRCDLQKQKPTLQMRKLRSHATAGDWLGLARVSGAGALWDQRPLLALVRPASREGPLPSPVAPGRQLLPPPASPGTLQSPLLTRGLGSGKLNCEKINIISSRLYGINACNKEP